jgi:hypothetical protein
MQIVAQALLVVQLARRPALALGTVSLCQACAFLLFALAGGGYADRLDRRRLLLVTQSCLAALAVLLGTLTALDVITVPVIAAAAFGSGVLLSFDQPARAALVSSLVPREELRNAVSLQSAVFSGASVVGPALAGLLITKIGIASQFFLNALSFSGVLLVLAGLKPGSQPIAVRERLYGQVREAFLSKKRKTAAVSSAPRQGLANSFGDSAIASVAFALRSVRRDAVVIAALSVYGALLFAGPSLQVLLPLLARERLAAGPEWLGVLFSAAGVGAVLGAVAVGMLEGSARLMGASALVFWVAAVMTVGMTRRIPVAFVGLLVMGGGQSVIGAVTATLLQTRVAAELRGRMMSLNTLLLMGVRPLGDFPVAALIAFGGIPVTTVVSGLVVAGSGIVAGLRVRRSIGRGTVSGH